MYNGFPNHYHMLELLLYKCKDIVCMYANQVIFYIILFLQDQSCVIFLSL